MRLKEWRVLRGQCYETENVKVTEMRHQICKKALCYETENVKETEMSHQCCNCALPFKCTLFVCIGPSV